jgi:hypothetical protein
MLTENELNFLYDRMIELLEERKEFDKIKEINLETEYKENNEDDISFNEYVNDWIYEKICCE